MGLLIRGCFSREELEASWDQCLETYRINKKLVDRYNTKQALIEALRRLGVSDVFSKNEILLQFLIAEFSDVVEPFPFVIGSSFSKRIIDNLEYFFEDTIKSYISILKNKIIVREDENYSLITILEHSYRNECDGSIDADLWLNKIVNKYYFENGYIKKNEVLFNRQNGCTTIRRNTSNIITRHNKEDIGLLSTTKENTYNESCVMLSDTEYVIENSMFEIQKFAIASDKVYTSRKSLNVKDSQTCVYIEENKIQGLYLKKEFEVEYSKVGFDFMHFIQDNISEETDLNYRVNSLSESQIDYYESKNIDVNDYMIKWDNNDFYSTVYEFSMEMLKNINDFSSGSKVLKFQNMVTNYR